MSDRSDGGSNAFAVVNRSVPRRDAVAKVTGAATYTSDLQLPGMLHAALVRSDRAHARIVSIDASTALRRDGVSAVLTGSDIEKLPHSRYGHAVRDHPVLAIGKVRFVGEPVAAVIARDERTAQEAVPDVIVEYEGLPPVLDVDAAMAPQAPLIHGERYEQGSGGAVTGPVGQEGSNVIYHEHLEWGDVTAALAGAAHVVEGEYRFPMAYAYAMEPHVSVAEYEAGAGLEVWSSAQHPYMVRNDLAWLFGLPLSKVRVRVPYVGGGYGSKSYTKIEPIAAACAWKARRPVGLRLSVEEAILTTRLASARIWLRTGIDLEGRIVGREATLWFDGGAYAENSALGASKSAERALGPYRCPAARVDSYVVYTNTAPASSFRGFGSTQATMASEAQLDELAEQSGQDRIELRQRNLFKRGERMHHLERPLDGDLPGDLRLLGAALGWRGPLPERRGRGIGLMAMSAGASPVTSAQVRVHSDDSASVMTGSTEVGQGSETLVAQIAAEELQLPLDRVSVLRSDTSLTPFERSTGASRTTTVQGRAVMEASRDAARRLCEMAAEVLEVPAHELRRVRGGVAYQDRVLTWGSVIRRYVGIEGGEVNGYALIRLAGEFKARPTFFELNCAGVELTVDPETGVVKLDRLAVVADVGLAIHPKMLEGQDMGAAMMGVGTALFEELIYDGEQLSNGSLLTYRVPRFSDLPGEVRIHAVENRDGVGPYGAKGAGEGAVCAIAPAVLSAFHDATGVRLREVPLTPERVWRALRSARKAGP